MSATWVVPRPVFGCSRRELAPEGADPVGQALEPDPGVQNNTAAPVVGHRDLQPAVGRPSHADLGPDRPRSRRWCVGEGLCPAEVGPDLGRLPDREAQVDRAARSGAGPLERKVSRAQPNSQSSATMAGWRPSARSTGARRGPRRARRPPPPGARPRSGRTRPRLAMPQGQRQAHEPLLGAIVEVALHPAPLAVPGLHDAGPRGLHLQEPIPQLGLEALVVQGEGRLGADGVPAGDGTSRAMGRSMVPAACLRAPRPSPTPAASAANRTTSAAIAYDTSAGSPEVSYLRTARQAAEPVVRSEHGSSDRPGPAPAGLRHRAAPQRRGADHATIARALDVAPEAVPRLLEIGAAKLGAILVTPPGLPGAVRHDQLAGLGLRAARRPSPTRWTSTHRTVRNRPGM